MLYKFSTGREEAVPTYPFEKIRSKSNPKEYPVQRQQYCMRKGSQGVKQMQKSECLAVKRIWSAYVSII